MATNKLYEMADAQAHAAEEILTNILKQAGYLVKNVRDDKEYQGKDIDLIAREKTNIFKPITIEVKSDNYYRSNGNFSIETVSNVSKGTIGWGLGGTQADIIAIYYPTADEWFILDGKALTAWFAKNHDRKNKYGKDEFYENMNSTQDRYVKNKVLYYSKFRLVKRSVVEKEIGFINHFKTSDYFQ